MNRHVFYAPREGRGGSPFFDSSKAVVISFKTTTEEGWGAGAVLRSIKEAIGIWADKNDISKSSSHSRKFRFEELLEKQAFQDSILQKALKERGIYELRVEPATRLCEYDEPLGDYVNSA